MIALGLLVFAVAASTGEQPPESSAASGSEPEVSPPSARIAAMRRIWVDLELEELDLRKARLIGDLPGFGGAIAMTVVGGVLTAGSVAFWVGMGASGGLRSVGSCGGWSCILTFIVVLGVVIASAAGIAGLVLLIMGPSKYQRTLEERSALSDEIRKLDARMSALARQATTSRRTSASDVA